MSYISDRYDVEKLPNQSLAVIQCGKQICHSGHSSGSLIYKHYSAHFIIEGKGTYTVNGKTYELEPGMGFMITPGISNVYVADVDEPWRYIYATFFGADDDSLVHNAGLDDENVIFTFPMDNETIGNLYAMHAASKSYEGMGYDVTGYFLLAMSKVIKTNAFKKTTNYSPEHYVKKSLEFIENNYPYGITIKDIANFVGIDRTYLYRLFGKFVGKSPTQYLNDYRLIKSVEMMENENVSITEIALSTGFYDLSHFYKAFNSRYNQTPKKYRDTVYGGNNNGKI